MKPEAVTEAKPEQPEFLDIPLQEADKKAQEAPAPEPADEPAKEAAPELQQEPAKEATPEPAPQPAATPQPAAAPQPASALLTQPGSKPVPHLIREKTGEAIYFDKPEFTIGRSEKADRMISDNSDISRIHATIIQKNGVNYIKDSDSTNHTFVDGMELLPDEEVLLKNGAVVRIGNEDFTFHLR